MKHKNNQKAFSQGYGQSATGDSRLCFIGKGRKFGERQESEEYFPSH